MTNDAEIDINPAQALELVEGGAVLLDVREDDEWVAGHAPQAIHVAMSRIGGEYTQLPTNTPIVCVCHLGGRSSSVAENLRRVGLDARNLSGGMDAWASSGLAVVDEAGNPGTVI